MENFKEMDKRFDETVSNEEFVTKFETETHDCKQSPDDACPECGRYVEITYPHLDGSEYEDR